MRALLVEKFGKEVALASMEGEGVAERVERKLRVETPKPELVDAYLTEIARFYGVPYGDPEPAQEEDDDDDEPSSGVAEENPQELESALEADSKASRKEDERTQWSNRQRSGGAEGRSGEGVPVAEASHRGFRARVCRQAGHESEQLLSSGQGIRRQSR